MAEYEPLIIERAKGCTLYDIDGRAYLDGVSSLWCNIHGHRHPRIDAAIREQLDKVAHVTNLGSSNPTTIELAKRLVDLAPPGLGHVFFSDDGATAVEVALKMAFQYWRQRKNPKPTKRLFVALDGAYHGDTLGSVSVGGVERFHAMFRPLLFEVLRLPAPDTYRLPPGVSLDGAAAHYLSQLEELLAARHERDRRRRDRAARAGGGRNDHAPARLSSRRSRIDAALRRAADRRRSRRRLWANWHDVRLRARGCVAGFSLPGEGPHRRLSAAGGDTDDATKSGTHFSARMPKARLSSMATPTAATRSGPRRPWRRSTSSPKSKRSRIFDRRSPDSRSISTALPVLPHVGHVRQRGLIAAIELVRDEATKAPYPWVENRGQRVCDFVRGEGVLLRPLGNVIVIMPPLSITLDELDRICLAIEHGIPVATAD